MGPAMRLMACSAWAWNILGAHAAYEVDLRPCLLTSAAVTEASPSAYIIAQYFQGFWSPNQHFIVDDGAGELDLTYSSTSGKCNAVFVAYETSDARIAELQAYSRTFKARIVYLESALTANNDEVAHRLAIAQYFALPFFDEEYPYQPSIKLTPRGNELAGVVKASSQTYPGNNRIFTRPVLQWLNGTSETDIVANYCSEAGVPITTQAGGNETFQSVAAMLYTDGDLEEMHVFFQMAWFDMGSWVWTHFFAEWATKGTFVGERRFYLAAMVDDFFMSTNEWEYDPATAHVGDALQVTDTDLDTYIASQTSLNSVYGSAIKVELAYNGLGILQKVGSAHAFIVSNSDAGLLDKGVQNTDEGLGIDLIDSSWLSGATPGMIEEFSAGNWTGDRLLMKMLEPAISSECFVQSHAFSHLARDSLSASDCHAEDRGNTQLANATGMYGHSNYNWRSMTTPGITGLFNPSCLKSAMDQAIFCAAGDNTYPILVSNVSSYHSINTTEELHGVEGFQIVPRYPTRIYHNCYTPKCAWEEDQFIRRQICLCEELDPSKDRGDCTGTSWGCPGSTETPDGFTSFESFETLMEAEEETIVRQILSGRRDKYMFHQLNMKLTPFTDVAGVTGTISLLHYWHEAIMAKLASVLDLSAVPIQSLKFDDLCQDFSFHVALDSSEARVSAIYDNAGDMSAIRLHVKEGMTAGRVPLTVPLNTSIPSEGVIVGSTITYGIDKTYYLATSMEDIPIVSLEPPDVTSLAAAP